MSVTSDKKVSPMGLWMHDYVYCTYPAILAPKVVAEELGDELSIRSRSEI